HVINGDGIHVDSSKIEAVKNWKAPRTSTEVRSCLGLARWYEVVEVATNDWYEVAEVAGQLTNGRVPRVHGDKKWLLSDA
ncbi:hypothetical protein Tco_0987296, partial [Tanacetum coccineum]